MGRDVNTNLEKIVGQIEDLKEFCINMFPETPKLDHKDKSNKLQIANPFVNIAYAHADNPSKDRKYRRACNYKYDRSFRNNSKTSAKIENKITEIVHNKSNSYLKSQISNS